MNDGVRLAINIETINKRQSAIPMKSSVSFLLTRCIF